MSSQREKCQMCAYLDAFNCCCSKEPIMTCVAEMEEHDKEVRAKVIDEIRTKIDCYMDFGGFDNRMKFFDMYDNIAEQLKEK